MSTADTSVVLVMSAMAANDLWVRAHVPVMTDATGACELRDALRGLEVTEAGEIRVRCDEAALAFIRAEAPEIARRWPEVFGDVEVPRTARLAMVCANVVGQTVAGVEVDRHGGLRLVFETGDAFLVGPDGSLDWRAA